MISINHIAIGAYVLLTFAVCQADWGQSSSNNAPPKPPLGSMTAGTNSLAPSGNYVLGGGDQVQVDVPDLPDEFNFKVFRVNGDGHLRLPLAGDIRVGGLTVSQAEAEVREHLTSVLKSPDVVVTVVGFGSESVSVLGAVNNPGIVQLAGARNLFEVLSLAGGLRPDAGYQATITRNIATSAAIPLPHAQADSSGQYSVASVELKQILAPENARENVMILPGDRISVPATDLVYVIGNVVRPGGYPLNQHASLSALQVVSLAQGYDKTAAPQKATILRIVPGSSNRIEIAADLKTLAKGESSDIPLVAGDILYVPGSKAKAARVQIQAMVVAASGAAVYAAAPH